MRITLNQALNLIACFIVFSFLVWVSEGFILIPIVWGLLVAWTVFTWV